MGAVLGLRVPPVFVETLALDVLGIQVTLPVRHRSCHSPWLCGVEKQAAIQACGGSTQSLRVLQSGGRQAPQPPANSNTLTHQNVNCKTNVTPKLWSPLCSFRILGIPLLALANTEPDPSSGIMFSPKTPDYAFPATWA